MLVMTCCKSIPNEKIKLRWSTFPNPKEIVILEGEFVKMPLDYWIKITEYVCDVETNIEIINNDFLE